MSLRKMLVPAAFALVCALGAGAAQARTDVQWSINIGLPVYAQPVYAQPVYAQPVYAQPVYAPAPVYYEPAPVYAPVAVYPAPVAVYLRPAPVYVYGRYVAPARWDRNRNGIPDWRESRYYRTRWDDRGGRWERGEDRRNWRDHDGDRGHR